MNLFKVALFTKNDIKPHIIAWGLVIIFVCLIDPIDDKFSIQFLGTFLIILAYMFVYYTQYLVAFSFIKTNIVLAFLLMFLIFMGYLSIIFLNFHYVFGMFRYKDKVDYSEISDWVMSCFILFSIISVIAYGFYQNKISINKLLLEYEKEKNILNKELGFYKNQFNPHITFNFLNYCYSFVNQKSPETADIIEIYSEMLRYTINCKPNEVVSLKNEINFLYKFIALKKQLSKDIFVQFDVKGEILQKNILPCILITFVENAFKHGDLHCEENPIRIKLETTDYEIKFEVINKKNASKNKPTSTGIGLLNMKNLLELFYKNKHELIVNDSGSGFYSAAIILNLK